MLRLVVYGNFPLLLSNRTVPQRLAVAAREDWQTILARAIRDPVELCRRLGLPEELAAEAARSTAAFRVLVPQPYLARIRPGDPDDPLLAQVLPRKAEMADAPQFVPDPLHEAATVRTPGLLGKYKGRFLIVASGVCAVHCRFCFRRHFPYVQALSGHAWSGVFRQIAAETSIEEVILSGGDPLTTARSPPGGNRPAACRNPPPSPAPRPHAAADRDSPAGER